MHALAKLLALAAGLHMSQAEMKRLTDSCDPKDTQFYGESKVGFWCLTGNNNPDLKWKYSLFDLSYCIGISEAGRMVPMPRGNYQDTCKNCELVPASKPGYDTCFLECKCPVYKHRISVDLNDVLFNVDGKLWCSGLYGPSSKDPPPCYHNPKCSDEPRLTPRALPTGAGYATM